MDDGARVIRAMICTMALCAGATPHAAPARAHAARPVTFPADPVPAAGIVPEDGLMVSAGNDGALADWRLPQPEWRDPDADDALRWRVKVRPNRAMGRISLSF